MFYLDDYIHSWYGPNFFLKIVFSKKSKLEAITDVQKPHLCDY